MNDERDFERAASDWLNAGTDVTPRHVIDAVLLAVRTTAQERDLRVPWRTPIMNRIIGFGLAAAAGVAAALIGSQLIGSPSGGVGSAATPTLEASATPEPSIADPSPSADAILPEGPFAWFEPADPPEPPNDGPPITVTIPTSGWSCLGGINGCTLGKGDGVDPYWNGTSDSLPESALIVTTTTSGILVYEDPCQWEYLVPDPPATTADEIAAALAAQPFRNASGPVDVTVGGFPAKMVTLHVPDDAAHSRGGSFTECFRGAYASYTLEGHDAEGAGPWRQHQGPGQIDTFWIVDVDGAIVIINAMYRPDTPADRIQEMRVIAESATFEMP